MSQQILAACARGDFDLAEQLRGEFLPLEDLRDAWGPARVLHAAVEHADIARTGAIPPFVSELDEARQREIGAEARQLLTRNQTLSETHAVAGN